MILIYSCHCTVKKKKKKMYFYVTEKKHIPIQSLLLALSSRYKSNEDYVYVRGRGRGKYICEECGIRCKKPSMLKKHIRTHTDVRPYVCKFCNFAFKTKGRASFFILFLFKNQNVRSTRICQGLEILLDRQIFCVMIHDSSFTI